MDCSEESPSFPSDSSSSGSEYDWNGDLIEKEEKMDPKQRYLNDALQYAIQTNNQEEVLKLLNQGADPNWECKISTQTPLMICVMLEHIDILKLLLENGGDAAAFLELLSYDNMEDFPYNVLAKHTDILVYIFEHVVRPGKATDLERWNDLVNLVTLTTYSMQDSNVNCVKLTEVFLNCKIDQSVDKQKEYAIICGQSFQRISKSDLAEVMLFNAVEAGSKDCVELLSDHGVEVNIYFAELRAMIPLQEASSTGKLDMVKLLIERGAKVVGDKTVQNPLEIAYKKNHVEVVKFLMTEGYTSETLDKFPLHVACLVGDEKKVKKLMKEGVDVNGKDMINGQPLERCIQGKNLTVLNMLLKCPKVDKHRETKKNWGAVDYLPCELLNNPLFQAVETGDIKVVTAVLDALVGKKSLEKYCSYSNDLLCRAVEHQAVEIFDVLLKRGASLKPREPNIHHKQAIHFAAEAGNLYILKTLVERGADVNWYCEEEEEYGYRQEDLRPLYLCRDKECIRYLLEKGASYHCLEAEIAARSFLSIARSFAGPSVDSMDNEDMNTKLEKIREIIGQEKDENSDPFPPYMKLIETGNIDALRVYFEKHGAALCKNSSLFHMSCLNGQFDLVQYLIKQNPDWLWTLGYLTLMFSKRDEDFEEKIYCRSTDHVFFRSESYMKVLDMLFKMGCTFNFKQRELKKKRPTLQRCDSEEFDYDTSGPEDSDLESEEEDNEIPPNEAASSILESSYLGQRYLFCRLLQDLCGRNVNININDFLKAMMTNNDCCTIMHLINCGHKIDLGYEGRRLLRWRKQYKKRKQEKFVSFIEDASQQPLGLQSLCRVKIRGTLFDSIRSCCNINQFVEKLPLPSFLKQYLEFTGQFEHSYLQCTSTEK